MFKTSDLDEFEDATNNLVMPHTIAPSTRGKHADGELQLHGSRDFAAFSIRYGRQLAVMHPEQSDGRLAFVMATKGTGQLVLGREELEVSGQQGVVFTSGERKMLRYMDDCETAVIMLDRRKVAEYCAKLLGRDINGNIDFEALLPLDNSSGQSWLRLFQYASAEMGDPRSLMRTLPGARQQLEQMVMTGLLFGHAHNFSAALLQPQSAAAPYYVKRAEAYIEAHFAEPLSLADIATHASVSARSLQNGFQSFRATTPMAFLRSVRVQHAHQALLAADPVTSTVMDIAMNCGFSHMGEFAAIYKRTFGTAPSQTLLKAAQR